MNIAKHSTKIHLMTHKHLYATSRRTASVDGILDGAQRDGVQLHSFAPEQEV
jgi:hypothetical protein